MQVLLVTGMGLVAYHTKEYHDELTKISGSLSNDPYDIGQFGRYEFFMYTTGVGVGIAVLGFVCALTGKLEKKHGVLAVGIGLVIHRRTRQGAGGGDCLYFIYFDPSAHLIQSGNLFQTSNFNTAHFLFNTACTKCAILHTKIGPA
jgi:hypothetical protein